MTSSTVEIISAIGSLLSPIAAILGAFLTAYLTKIWNTDEPDLPRYTPGRQSNTLPPQEALPRFDPPTHTLCHAQSYPPHPLRQTPQYRAHQPLHCTGHQLLQSSSLYQGQSQHYQPNNQLPSQPQRARQSTGMPFQSHINPWRQSRESG